MPYAEHTILTPDNKPSKALLDLLSLLDIEHDGTLENIIAITQKLWLRKPGAERWEMDEMHADKRTAILKLLDQLGCMQAVEPTQKEYEYGIILGATVFRARTRLAYLLDLWQQGIRFKTLIFLGSERPLDPTIESPTALLDMANYKYADHAWQATNVPTTEYEMLRMVYEQTNLPPEFATIPVVFVNAPMQITPDGKMRRATTYDSIITWLSYKPVPGSCLFISNNPYIGYQDSTVRSAMPRSFLIETAGQASSSGEKIAVYLDNLARWLYQERIRRQAIR